MKEAELHREPLVRFLSAFYRAADWKQLAKNTSRHDLFERRVAASISRRDFRQIADALARNLAISALPEGVPSLIDELDALGLAVVAHLRRELRYWVALGVDAAWPKKETKEVTPKPIPRPNSAPDRAKIKEMAQEFDHDLAHENLEDSLSFDL